MLFLLLALYYLNPTVAVPTPLTVVSGAQSESSKSYDLGNTRTLANIVWSCLSTIFGCTLLAIHPNVPEPENAAETQSKTKFSKVVSVLKRFVKYEVTL